MKVWMTIGYADREGNDKVDGVHTNKDEAITLALETIFEDWAYRYDDENRTIMGLGKDAFVSRVRDYIYKHPEVKYWYLWSGSDFWKEIFSDWTDESCYTWIGIKEVEFNPTDNYVYVLKNDDPDGMIGDIKGVFIDEDKACEWMRTKFLQYKKDNPKAEYTWISDEKGNHGWYDSDTCYGWFVIKEKMY